MSKININNLEENWKITQVDFEKIINEIQKPIFPSKKTKSVRDSKKQWKFWKKSTMDKEVHKREMKYYLAIWKTYDEIHDILWISKQTIVTYAKEIKEERLKSVDKSIKKMQEEAVWRLDWYILKVFEFFDDVHSPQQVATLMNVIQKQEELRAKIWGYLINKIEEKSNKLDEFLNKL